MNKRTLTWVAGIGLLLIGAIVIFAMNFNAPTSITQTPIAPSSEEDLARFPRPQAPADGDTFREDHPSHVASTGRPQLIEFFAFT